MERQATDEMTKKAKSDMIGLKMLWVVVVRVSLVNNADSRGWSEQGSEREYCLRRRGSAENSDAGKLRNTHRGLSPSVVWRLVARREGIELLNPRAAGEAVRFLLGEGLEGERVRDCLEVVKECRVGDTLVLLLLLLFRSETEEEEGAR